MLIDYNIQNVTTTYLKVLTNQYKIILINSNKYREREREKENHLSLYFYIEQ